MPELELIQSRDLKEKVVAAWALSCSIGGYTHVGIGSLIGEKAQLRAVRKPGSRASDTVITMPGELDPESSP